MSAYTEEDLVILLRDGAIGSLFPLLYENVGDGARTERQYIFSRFVQHLKEQEPSLLDGIDSLRKAAIFSDLILNLQTPRPKPANAQTVVLYLDSPLVMDAVGLSGPARKAFSQRLLREATRLGFEPNISPGMLFEVRNNVRALLQRSPRDRFGPTADALRRGEIRQDFVEAILERLESTIDNAGIKTDIFFEGYAPKGNFTNNHFSDLLSKLSVSL